MATLCHMTISSSFLDSTRKRLLVSVEDTLYIEHMILYGKVKFSALSDAEWAKNVKVIGDPNTAMFEGVLPDQAET